MPQVCAVPRRRVPQCVEIIARCTVFWSTVSRTMISSTRTLSLKSVPFFVEEFHQFKTSSETVEDSSITQIENVKLEDDIKDDISNSEYDNDEQIFSAPLERTKPMKRKTENKRGLLKKLKLTKDSSKLSNGRRVRLLNKPLNKEVLKNLQARLHQTNSKEQKRRRGPKPNPNGLTPEEMKIQDKFAVKRLTVLEKRKQETRGKQQQVKKKPVRPKASTYCQTCDLTCSSRNWSKHIATIGHKIKTNEDFTCSVCKESLPSGEALRLHNRRLHPKRCGRSRGNPLLPKSWPAKCPHCNEELPDAQKYYWHFRKAHPDEPYPLIKNYICDVCGKRFKDKIKIGNGTGVEVECGAGIEIGKATKTEIESGTRLGLTTNAYLVYHRRTHFNDRPYKCTQCPKAFFEKQNLVIHEKWHSDQRPFPCSVCCKAFKTRGALQRHFMLHTGEKPYVCEFCGKAFNQSNSRKGHVKAVHLKEPTTYSRSRPRRPAARPPPRAATMPAEASLELPASEEGGVGQVKPKRAHERANVHVRIVWAYCVYVVSVESRAARFHVLDTA
ncbi:Zinc finger protein 79 [Eumeta japonica]|uniref:Zinc finger protein 79 n=1 Tax=Eumeta variegata TaxID=151549 RepID=A0A4C1SX25_EUMVA|nr:Zinc finger protein 79 [Eumeta japonica]